MMISPTSLLWVISMISIPMAIKKATNPIIFFIYEKLLHLIISLYAASPQIFQVMTKKHPPPAHPFFAAGIS